MTLASIGHGSKVDPFKFVEKSGSRSGIVTVVPTIIIVVSKVYIGLY